MLCASIVYTCILIYLSIHSSLHFALKTATRNKCAVRDIMYVNIRIHGYMYIYVYPPDPMNHAKIFKGWSPRDAPSELVPQWYKTFPPDHFGRVEMNKPTRFSNKTSTA